MTYTLPHIEGKRKEKEGKRGKMLTIGDLG